MYVVYSSNPNYIDKVFGDETSARLECEIAWDRERQFAYYVSKIGELVKIIPAQR